MRRLCALVAVLVWGAATDAAAQAAAKAGRFEIGAGVEWLGATDFGSADATETTPTGASSPLFSTATTLKSAIGFQAAVGIRITDAFEAQAIGAISEPALSTSISHDIEASGDVTATENIRQYVIGGGLLWYLPVRTSPKLAPFATGNVAYLRQLHEGKTLVATGQLYRVSGGVKYLFSERPASRFKGYGLRAEAGFAARVDGVAFDSRARYSPWVAASIFARFGSRH
jgi:hypothetical protein